MDKCNRKTKQRKEAFETDIGNDSGYSQVEDAVMKTVMQCFKDELLPYFGIKEKAVAYCTDGSSAFGTKEAFARLQSGYGGRFLESL